MAKQNPRIIAHRGASGSMIENTLAAFEQAMALGADGVELDIHETRDGRFVIHHDADLPRGRIRELHLSEIRGYPGKRGGAVPALEDALQLLSDLGATDVFIEIKALESGSGLQTALAPWRNRLQIELHSFSERILRTVSAWADGYPLGLIVNDAQPERLQSLCRLPASALSARYTAVTSGVVEDVHDLDCTLHVWTVNDPARAKVLATMGVDSLITDWPDKILAGIT